MPTAIHASDKQFQHLPERREAEAELRVAAPQGDRHVKLAHRPDALTALAWAVVLALSACAIALAASTLWIQFFIMTQLA